MKAIVSGILFLLCIADYSGLVQAQEEVRVKPVDVYISGFGGYSFSFNTDISSGGTVLLQNAEYEKSPSFGGKVGLWFTAPRKTLGIDIGAEIDVTRFDPDPTLNATYFGVNLMARLPMGVEPELPNARWFPYIGIGGGAQRLNFELSGLKRDDISPAFQGLWRAKVFIVNHIAGFVEGKFTHVSHTLESLDITLNALHGVGGLSLHF